MANDNPSLSSNFFDQAQRAGGNHFLLFDQSQLSISGIRIAAQCTFEEFRTSQRSSTEPVRSSSDHEIHSITSNSISTLPQKDDDASSSVSGLTNASSSRPTSNFPPSSFRDPLAGRDVSKVRRPRSAEIGARAKGAMMEFGRVARELPKGLYGLRNLSKSDVSDSRETQMIIAPSMNDIDSLIAISPPSSSIDVNQRRSSNHSLIESTDPRSNVTSSNSQPFPVKVQEDDQDTIRRSNVKSILRVRRLYRLRPCSSSTNVRNDTFLGQAVPISIINRTEARFASIGSEDSGWKRLEGSATEYMVDVESTAMDNPFPNKSRDTSEGQESSDFDLTQELEQNHLNSMKSSNLNDTLLLKVQSPITAFANIAGPERMASVWRDEVVLKMRIQLRINESDTDSIPLSPSSLKPTPIGPRRLQSHTMANNSSGDQCVIFVSCNSTQKLCDAIENDFSGPLISQSSSKLEGIEWIPVPTTMNSKPTDFEWAWKDPSISHASGESNYERHIKCACAFILLDKTKKLIIPLAFFQFMINKLSVSQIASQIPPTMMKNSQSLPDTIPHREMMFNGQPIGLGLEGVDPKFTIKSPKSSLQDNLSGQQTNGKSRSSKPRVTLSSSPTLIPQQLSQSEQLFASPGVDSTADMAPIQFSGSDLNHVEIGLDDVETDSPIYRAALQNVERRTVNLKRVAKGMLKAADDVSQAIEELQVTEVRLDHTFEDMAGLMPATFARLSSDILFKSREAERERREQAIAMLEIHVITPMRAVADMCRELMGQLKTFESESKAYYSATQKWLSSKSSAAQNSINLAGNEYSSDAIGFDKAMIKQEKLDEKQKWRQLRFDLSRFEMYRSICSLHEGEAELLVASHMLALCRWQSKDLGKENIFRDFDSLAQSEMVNVKAKAESALEKCLELEKKLAEHHRLMLSRENEGQMGIEPSPIPEIASDNQLGIATRQAGNKLKNLLTSIGVGHTISQSPQNMSTSIRQPFSCPIPPASNFDTLDTDSPSKQSRQQAIFDPKSPNGSIAINSPSMPLPSGNKWQKRLRTFSFTRSPNLQDSEHRILAEVNQNTLIAASQSSNARMSVPDVNVTEAETSVNEETPTKRVPSSSGRKPSPTRVPIPLDLSSVTSSKSFNDSQTMITKALLSPLPSSTQPQRKKEGILWTMTKPIQGLGSSDAPKSVSRSQNWRESWVVLSGSGHLGEYAHWKDSKGMTLEPSQPLIDLRFATVREARGVERRFTFEVITRESRRFYQASNDESMQEWIGAISFAIESLINGTSSVRQIDKVARNSVVQAVDSFGVINPSSPQEFGDGMRHVFDHAISPSTNGIGVHKSFSQSLTDLSSAASGKLFSRYGGNGSHSTNREEPLKSKRDSRNLNNNSSRGHLLALSEGDHSVSNNSTVTDPFTPLKNDRHSRGISNNTPLSGYIDAGAKSSNNLDVHDGRSSSSSALNVYTEFDRRIEEMVHTNYGGESCPMERGSGLHSQSHSSNHDSTGNTISSSTAASRVPSSIGQASVDEEGRLLNNNSFTPTIMVEDSMSKAKRAQEIMTIASLPENRTCADCRKPDPRWASWSLNGTPCCIFICIACSGVHRGLGVSVSKVRSVDLDDWNEKQIRAARLWGNERVNAIYEARKPIECTVSSMGDVRTKAFWMTKYVEQAWFSLHPQKDAEVDKTITADGSEEEVKISSHNKFQNDNYTLDAKVQGSPPSNHQDKQKVYDDDVIYHIGRSGDQAETRRWSTKLVMSSSETNQQNFNHRTSLPPTSNNNQNTSTRWRNLDQHVLSSNNTNSPMPRISA